MILWTVFGIILITSVFGIILITNYYSHTKSVIFKTVIHMSTRFFSHTNVNRNMFGTNGVVIHIKLLESYSASDCYCFLQGLHLFPFVLEPSTFTWVTGGDVSRVFCLAKELGIISCCHLASFRQVREVKSQCACQFASSANISLPATVNWRGKISFHE